MNKNIFQTPSLLFFGRYGVDISKFCYSMISFIFSNIDNSFILRHVYFNSSLINPLLTLGRKAIVIFSTRERNLLDHSFVSDSSLYAFCKRAP